MQPFRAFRIHQEGGRIVPRLETIALDDLNAGDVVIKVSHSTINYKDALAATGAGKILRKYPLVGGIDLAGVVVSGPTRRSRPAPRCWSTAADSRKRTTAVTPSTRASQPTGSCRFRHGLDEFQAMAIGTAGYTAALAIHRMEQNGQQPQGGEVVVTGATGGVGSLAIDMLAGRGYKVVAVTGKRLAADYLRELGASEVLLRSRDRPRQAADGRSALGRRDRQRRRRAAHLADAHRRISGATSPASAWPAAPS